MGEWTGTQDQCHGERKESTELPLLLQELFEICCCFVRTHERMHGNFWCFFQKTSVGLISKQTKQLPAHS